MKATKVKAIESAQQKYVCVVCEKTVFNYYGRWGNTGTCSKSCEEKHEAKVSKLFKALNRGE